MFYFSANPKATYSSMSTIDYDLYWHDRGFALNKKLKEREVIIESIIAAGAKVFDVGCGNSLLPVTLKNKGVHVTVGDISGEVLKGFEAHSIRGHLVDLENTVSLSSLDFYDYIIMSEVLEHTRNPEEIIKILRTHTKNFLLTIPNSAFYRYRLHLLCTGSFLRQWVHHPGEHLRYWSHTDFLEWLQSLGLVIKKTEASNGLTFLGIKFYKLFPNMFGHQIVYFCETQS